eukprot:g3768.t1
MISAPDDEKEATAATEALTVVKYLTELTGDAAGAKIFSAQLRARRRCARPKMITMAAPAANPPPLSLSAAAPAAAAHPQSPRSAVALEAHWWVQWRLRLPRELIELVLAWLRKPELACSAATARALCGAARAAWRVQVATGLQRTAYWGCNDGKLHAISLADGATRWTFDTRPSGTGKGYLKCSPAVSDDGRHIYIASSGSDERGIGGRVYAVDAALGVRHWRSAPMAGAASSTGIVLSANGAFLFVGCADGHAYCFHTADGALAWRSQHQAAGAVMTTPALGRLSHTCPGPLADAADAAAATPRSGSVLSLYYGTRNGVVVAVQAADGALRWTSPPLGGRVWSSPVLAADGATVYVGVEGSSASAGLAALSALDGTVLWRCSGIGDPLYSNAALSRGAEEADGAQTLYVGSGDRHLYAVSAGTGKVRWRYKTQGVTWYSSPTLSPDQRTVYIGSADKHLHAVCAETGEGRWKANVGRTVLCSPAVSADGRRVVVGASQGRIRAFDTAGGREQWEYTASGDVRIHRGAMGPL